MAKKKSHLTEVKGNREYLSPFVGKEFDAKVFVTNIEKYGTRRLLTEVTIPQINVYIGHLWIKEFRLPMSEVSSGKKILKVRIKSYMDQSTGETKYGVKLVSKKRFKKAPLIKPIWMKDED
jgi:hypothetical protein